LGSGREKLGISVFKGRNGEKRAHSPLNILAHSKHASSPSNSPFLKEGILNGPILVSRQQGRGLQSVELTRSDIAYGGKTT